MPGVICDCCGTEFGYEDCTVEAAKAQRKRWLENGAKWFEAKYQPKDWKVEDQLANVPLRFK